MLQLHSKKDPDDADKKSEDHKHAQHEQSAAVKGHKVDAHAKAEQICRAFPKSEYMEDTVIVGPFDKKFGAPFPKK